MQKYCISIANALEVQQFCTEPIMWYIAYNVMLGDNCLTAKHKQGNSRIDIIDKEQKENSTLKSKKNSTLI